MLSLRGSESIAGPCPFLRLSAVAAMLCLFIKENCFLLFLSELGLLLCCGDVSVLFSEVVAGLVKKAT